MTTTTSYASWVQIYGTELTVDDSVRAALTGVVEDFDVDGIARDWRVAIDRALPQGVRLAGDEFIGPHPRSSSWENDVILEAVESVDFWEIAQRHSGRA